MIDIGTNSILLLIAHWNSEGKPVVVKQAFTVTRLGESISGDLVIRPGASTKAVTVLHTYQDMIKQHQAEQVSVVGTEMLRLAKNRSVFCDTIYRQFGWPVDIISGEEEGRLTYIGAVSGLAEANQPVLVIDVGGGSTELVRGIGLHIIKSVSLPLGVVRFSEKTGGRTQLPEDLCRDLRLEIKKSVSQTGDLLNVPSGTMLIGSGGTVTTVAAVKASMTTYDPEKLHGYILTQEDLDLVFQKLNRMSLEERRKVPGMLPGREDVLLYGILIFLVLMEMSGLRMLYATDRGLRFGYLEKQINTGV